MIVNPKHALRSPADDPSKPQFPGVRSAISGLRYYSPTLGRFINQDPIEEQGGLNLYAFCGNNGVNRWDRLGMIEYTYNEIGYDFVLDPQYGSFEDFIGAIHPSWTYQGNYRWIDPASGSGFEFGGSRQWDVNPSDAGMDPVDPSANWGQFDSLGFMFGVMDRMESVYQEKKAITAQVAQMVGNGVAVLIPNGNGSVDVVLAAKARWVAPNSGGEFSEPASVNANFAPKSGALYSTGDRLPTPPGVYSISAHGNQNVIYGPTGKRISPEQLASSLLNDPTYKYKPGTPVLLFACYTGMGTDNFASKLADLIGSTVTAPNNLLWWEDRGTPAQIRNVVAPSLYYDSTTGAPVRGPDGKWHPDLQNPGAMVPFNPRK